MHALILCFISAACFRDSYCSPYEYCFFPALVIMVILMTVLLEYFIFFKSYVSERCLCGVQTPYYSAVQFRINCK